jgi:hypothetical protein
MEATMSTGLNCEFNEIKPGIWYYLLESGFAPKCAWDWREYATAYGPFPTLEAGEQHLSDNHANPGGHMIEEYKEGFKPDEVLQKLIAEAKPPVEEERYTLRRWQ